MRYSQGEGSLWISCKVTWTCPFRFHNQASERRWSAFHYEPLNTNKRSRFNVTRRVFRKIWHKTCWRWILLHWSRWNTFQRECFCEPFLPFSSFIIFNFFFLCLGPPHKCNVFSTVSIDICTVNNIQRPSLKYGKTTGIYIRRMVNRPLAGLLCSVMGLSCVAVQSGKTQKACANSAWARGNQKFQKWR